MTFSARLRRTVAPSEPRVKSVNRYRGCDRDLTQELDPGSLERRKRNEAGIIMTSLELFTSNLCSVPRNTLPF